MLKSFLLTATIFLLTAQLGFTQKKYDNRLLGKFSETELKQIEKENPAQLKFLTYCIENAFYITDLPKEKAEKNDGRIAPIKLHSSTDISFYELNIELIQDDYQYYLIEGANRLLVVKSIDHIKKEMNDE